MREHNDGIVKRKGWPFRWYERSTSRSEMKDGIVVMLVLPGKLGTNVGSFVSNQAKYRYTNAAMHGTLVDGMQHGANVVIDSIT